MSEITIPAPIPLVWKGHYDDNSGEDSPDWEAGWAFFVNPGGYAAPKSQLRPELARLPILIACPGWYKPDGRLVPTPWCIDTPASSGAGYWDVTVDESTLIVGQQPMITCTPSIHLVGIWHGFVRDGRLVQA